MKLAILDDYMKVALASADWERIRRKGVDITVFDTTFGSADDAAAKLAPFETSFVFFLEQQCGHFSCFSCSSTQENVV